MIDPTPVLAWLRARQTYLVRTYDATLAAGDGAEAGRILARAQEIEHVRERVLGYLAGLPLDEPGEPKEGGPPRRGGVMDAAALRDADAALAEPEVALRVNDSNLFVYGNNEATKVVQDALSKPDALRERVAALEAERDALVSAILATIGGTVEGYPTTRLNYLQRLRQLTAREALADQLSEALTDWSGYRPPSVRRAHAAYRAGWEGRDG